MLGASDRRMLSAAAVATAASAVTRFVPTGTVVPFVVSAVALGVLAAAVGRAVDQLSERMGAGATGAIQSALGNLPELFFGIFALRAGLVKVVQAALVGSVLANVLLVLGAAILAGGLRHGTQRFHAPAARLVVLLLVLAVAVLVLPTFTAHLSLPAAAHEGTLSVVASVVLLGLFALSVPASMQGPAPAAHPDTATVTTGSWPLSLTVAVLAATSGAAAAVSDWFVNALTPALGTLHISQEFAGLVIVAIAGNAVENVVGIRLMSAGRTDHALSIILQSPVQIALALFPALVLLSYVIGGTALTLVLPPLLMVTLVIAVILTAFITFDGESTWLEGACLIGIYAVIAASFWWG